MAVTVEDEEVAVEVEAAALVKDQPPLRPQVFVGSAAAGVPSTGTLWVDSMVAAAAAAAVAEVSCRRRVNRVTCTLLCEET